MVSALTGDGGGVGQGGRGGGGGLGLEAMLAFAVRDFYACFRIYGMQDGRCFLFWHETDPVRDKPDAREPG